MVKIGSGQHNSCTSEDLHNASYTSNGSWKEFNRYRTDIVHDGPARLIGSTLNQQPFPDRAALQHMDMSNTIWADLLPLQEHKLTTYTMDTAAAISYDWMGTQLLQQQTSCFASAAMLLNSQVQAHKEVIAENTASAE